jgi:hypothetical protein
MQVCIQDDIKSKVDALAALSLIGLPAISPDFAAALSLLYQINMRTDRIEKLTFAGEHL